MGNQDGLLRYEELPDMLTIKELKVYLRIGWNAAYRIAREIPHYHCGNRRLFPKEKVREWALRQAERRAFKGLRAV